MEFLNGKNVRFSDHFFSINYVIMFLGGGGGKGVQQNDNIGGEGQNPWKQV